MLLPIIYACRFHTSIENKPMLSPMLVCPESILFSKTSLEKPTSFDSNIGLQNRFFLSQLFGKEQIRRWRCVCPESMLLFENSIQKETILSRSCACPESMLFFKNSIENELILSRRYPCPESMLFVKNISERTNSEREV